MRWIKALSLLLVSGFVIAFAAGPSAQLSWVAPTTYTDGTALPAADIAFYTITWGNPAGPQSLKVQGKMIAATIPIACGSAGFTVTVTTTSTAKYPNATSSPTGPVQYSTGIVCAPNPVSGLSVK